MTVEQWHEQIMRAVRARGLLHELAADRCWPWAGPPGEPPGGRPGGETFGVDRIRDGLPAIYLPSTPTFARAASRVLYLAGVDHYLGRLEPYGRGPEQIVRWERVQGAPAA